MSPRLTFARDTQAFATQQVARAVALEPAQGFELAALGAAQIEVQHSFRPLYDAFAGLAETVETATQPADLVHVTLPRARDLSRGLVAKACLLAAPTSGIVMIEGDKTGGVEPMLKAVRARVPLMGQVSKAHGKLFWFRATDAFADWTLADPAPVRDGWITQPGVFSADGPDAGSAALVAALPGALKGYGADLGGGWGYLSAHVVAREGVTGIDLIEADARALACARLNISDPRVTFHWADATTWGAAKSLDWVVMNPPFHTTRTPDAALGQAFIQSAARLLKPHGRLLMVANRHLPYETTLASVFKLVQEIAGDTRFKILQADKPKAPERTRTVSRR